MLAVLVLDSASLALIEELLATGRLPALAELRRRGRWHAVPAVPPPLDSGHFTLYTGRPLSEHGLHYLFQWVAEEQRLRYVHDVAQPELFWERLGARALVIDPYEGWGPRAGAGVFLRGLQFRERFVLPPLAAPKQEWRALARRLGRPPRIDDVYGRPSLDRLLRLRSVLTSAPARAVAAVAELLPRCGVDLLYVGFGSVHLAGHHFWDLSQLEPQDREAALAAGLDRALQDVYAAVDDALGRIVELLPADADLLVVSPSGMGPNSSRSDLLPAMLRLVLSGGGRAARGGDVGGAVWRVRGAIPASWRAAAVRPLPDAVVRGLTASLYLRGVDWRETRAFVPPGDYRGFVRLNLRGREREGIVDPAQAGTLLDELADGLATFCDPDGLPAVESVDRTERLVAEGEGFRLLPDLVVRWSSRPATDLRGLSSPRFGDVRRIGTGSGRPGNHADDAWILAVPGAARLPGTASATSLVDVAATAAALLAPGEAACGQPLLERAPRPG